jgi:hypothetical protein
MVVRTATDSPDINECSFTGADKKCSPDATCENKPGSWTCKCKEGFTGDGVTCAGWCEIRLLQGKDVPIII